MARSAARQPASIQQGPPPPAVAPADPASVGSAEEPKAAGLTLAWRVVLFIWASAFIFLLAYELLTTLVRSLSRLF